MKKHDLVTHIFDKEPNQMPCLDSFMNINLLWHETYAILTFSSSCSTFSFHTRIWIFALVTEMCFFSFVFVALPELTTFYKCFVLCSRLDNCYKPYTPKTILNPYYNLKTIYQQLRNLTFIGNGVCLVKDISLSILLVFLVPKDAH